MTLSRHAHLPIYLKGIFVLAALFILLGVFSGSPQQVALAHPLGNFTINHYSRIELAADHVTLRYVLDMAEIPAFQEKAFIDWNQDGQVSDQEKADYLASKAQGLREGLELLVNGSPIQLQVVSQELDFPPGQGGLPTLRIDLLLRGPLTLASGPGEQALYYRDDNYPYRLGWKEIVVKASEGASLVSSAAPQLDQSNELRAYPDNMLSSPPNLTEARSTFVLGAGIFKLASFKPIQRQ
jgi:nickel/cobalt transporter (NicO) family protein